MAWTIEYTGATQKQLRKLDKQTAKQLLDFLDQRIAKTDPRSTGKALTGALGGLWRYRVGDYRIICSIQDEKITVMVLQIGHRREVYKH